MRIETAGAKTWLLGAVAVWAVCVWLLAVFGLGGRVQRLPEDPALLPPLPQPGKLVPERLGPLSRYAEIGQRPLFSDDRQPHPFLIDPDGDTAGQRDFDYILTSVLHTPAFGMAILQPSGGGDPIRVKVGSAPAVAPNWTLASVDARSATFNGPEGERRFELRVFDGQGGQPPSPAANDPATSLPAMPRSTDDPAAPAPPGAKRTGGNAPASPAAPEPPGAAPQQGQPSQEQIDAIRRRIEERRARLRQESQSPPAQPPGPGKQP